MKTEIVWVAYDGHYATTILENVTDIQSLNGVVLFSDSHQIIFGIAISKLVYFKQN